MGKWYVELGRAMTSAERVKLYRKRHPGRRRNSQLKCKYGITELEWNALFEAQDSRCAICKATEPRGMGWHTDHDHETEIVRGILCNNCNVGLGLFKDNPELLIAASKYLGE